MSIAIAIANSIGEQTMYDFNDITQAMFDLLQDDEKETFITSNIDATNQTATIITNCLEDLSTGTTVEILESISQGMELDEYLGDWDEEDLVEYVIKKYNGSILNTFLENHNQDACISLVGNLSGRDIEKLFISIMADDRAEELIKDQLTNNNYALLQLISDLPADTVNKLLPEVIRNASLPELESAIGAHALIKNVTDYYPVEEVLAQTPEWFTVDNIKAIIATFSAEKQQQITGNTGNTFVKPRVRLHADGSVTLSEVHIAKQHVVRELPQD